jgi:hypothetical protein
MLEHAQAAARTILRSQRLVVMQQLQLRAQLVPVLFFER